MITSLELPDSLLEEAMAVAERDGLPLGAFIAEAIRSKLSAATAPAAKPWMKHFGSLRHLHPESELAVKIIEEEFETVDLQDWR